MCRTLALATDGFPKALATHSDWAVYGTIKNELVLTKNLQKVCSLKTSFTPTSACFSPNGNELAIGAEDNKVYFYLVSADGKLTLDAKQLTNNRGAVTCVSYSPDGQLLAVADTQRAIFVYDTVTKEVIDAS
jgi:WD40 repeat protein